MNLQEIKKILEDTKSGVIHHPEVYEEAVEYLAEKISEQEFRLENAKQRFIMLQSDKPKEQ